MQIAIEQVEMARCCGLCGAGQQRQDAPCKRNPDLFHRHHHVGLSFKSARGCFTMPQCRAAPSFTSPRCRGPLMRDAFCHGEGGRGRVRADDWREQGPRSARGMRAGLPLMPFTPIRRWAGGEEPPRRPHPEGTDSHARVHSCLPRSRPRPISRTVGAALPASSPVETRSRCSSRLRLVPAGRLRTRPALRRGWHGARE